MRGFRRRPRRRRRPTLGGSPFAHRRWELGAPLMVLGGLTAAATIGVDGGGFIFWPAVLLVGVGLSVFLRSR